MTIIITMAGRGSRFREAGYNIPKYEIVAHGRTLFEWSIRSLQPMLHQSPRIIFITLRENNSKAFIHKQCAAMGYEEVEIVEIDSVTDGQATTVLHGLALCDPTQSFAVYNIDTYIDPNSWNLNALQADPDGWVLCFPGPGSHWSFAKTDVNGIAIEFAEKVRISDQATVGLYYFKSPAIFQQAYEDTFLLGINSPHLKERYVAPMYNSMVKRGLQISVTNIALSAVVPLGTPSELNDFLNRSLG
jgi:NDP-sugar pyrophosphorylase family protein